MGFEGFLVQQSSSRLSQHSCAWMCVFACAPSHSKNSDTLAPYSLWHWMAAISQYAQHLWKIANNWCRWTPNRIQKTTLRNEHLMIEIFLAPLPLSQFVGIWCMVYLASGCALTDVLLEFGCALWSQHNFEKNLIKCSWSADGKQVAAGSADRNVYIWDTATRLVYGVCAGRVWIEVIVLITCGERVLEQPWTNNSCVRLWKSSTEKSWPCSIEICWIPLLGSLAVPSCKPATPVNSTSRRSWVAFGVGRLYECVHSTTILDEAASQNDVCACTWLCSCCVVDTSCRRIVYKLPGHKGTVNEVVFHPKEPVIASCGQDKSVYLGEIEPTYSV